MRQFASNICYHFHKVGEKQYLFSAAQEGQARDIKKTMHKTCGVRHFDSPRPKSVGTVVSHESSSYFHQYIKYLYTISGELGVCYPFEIFGILNITYVAVCSVVQIRKRDRRANTLHKGFEPVVLPIGILFAISPGESD